MQAILLIILLRNLFKTGKTALMYAVDGNFFDIVDLLMTHHVDIERTDNVSINNSKLMIIDYKALHMVFIG